MNPQAITSLIILLATTLAASSLPTAAAVNATESNSGHCELACVAVWDPVCGSDGKTYSNECFRRVAACKDPSINTQSPGECPDPCAKACTKEYKPVCSFDGVMYTQHSNQCVLSIAKCRAGNSGTKFEQRECPTSKPLCGHKYYCGDAQKCVQGQGPAQEDSYYCAKL